MNPETIVFDISVVLYSISFSWTVNERINRFPKIRRFGAIFAAVRLAIKPGDVEEREVVYSDLGVLLISWGSLFIFLAFSIHLIICYGMSLQRNGSNFNLIGRYIVPFILFLIPQFISRFISSMVLWLCPKEIRRLWNKDPNSFEMFSEPWRRYYGLSDGGIATGLIHDKARGRSLSSLMILLFLFSLLYLFSISWNGDAPVLPVIVQPLTLT